MPTLTIKGQNGTSFTVECDKLLQQQLLSPDTGKFIFNKCILSNIIHMVVKAFIIVYIPYMYKKSVVSDFN